MSNFKTINSDDDDYQDKAWDAFKADGGFHMEFGNGLVETFTKLEFFLDEEERDSNTEFGFMAGYSDGSGLLDACNIPEFVFDEIFDDLAEEADFTWNDAEAYHSVEAKRGNYKTLMPKIAAALLANGFVDGDGKWASTIAAPAPIKAKGGKLKSADHIDAINAFINEDRAVQDFIWSTHKDDQQYDQVPLKDRVTQLGGGMVMIAQGGYDFVPNGKKEYAVEADYWNSRLSHWPKYPLSKQKDWRREYRRKANGGIERRFELFADNISAVTLEVDGRIKSITIYGQDNYDENLKTRPEVLIKKKVF